MMTWGYLQELDGGSELRPSRGGAKRRRVGGTNGVVASMMHLAAAQTATAANGICPNNGALTFDDLLTRHQGEIYRYAYQLARNPADADDLYQETLIKAYRAFPRLDAGANYRAWLYKITTNTFLSERRKRGREDVLDEATEASLPAVETDHSAHMDARDLLADVEAFIACLPLKQRLALIQRKYHGLSYEDIAMNLKSTQVAARANVHEALRKLRDEFGDRL